MAENDGGDKTEKPTPHSLKEARKRGDTPKSRDVGLISGFVFAMILLWLTFGFVAEKLALLLTLTLESPGKPFLQTMMTIGKEATMTLILLSATLIIPIACFALLVEFLQTGPIMTVEKMLPKLSHINPVEGIKRMFSMDNLVELIKSVIQTSILFLIAVWTVLSAMNDITNLPFNNPLSIVSAISYLALRVFGWTCLAFILMACLDAAYQHHSFTKKMKMSMRDIKQEVKDMEGDPLLKGTRRQLAMEWSQENATAAARDASVLVVNPTHVAIALLYEPTEQKIPTISARAEDELALAMREAAEAAGTPVLRNEQLARALLSAQTEEDVVPRELFNIVAEVILWAQSVRRKLEQCDNSPIEAPISTHEREAPLERAAPGEDLTRYPPIALQGKPQ